MKNRIWGTLAALSLFAAILIAGYEGDKLWLMALGEMMSISVFYISLKSGGFFYEAKK